MKTFILYMLLVATGSGDPTVHLNANQDFGLYCSADTAVGKIRITVKATYYVKRGNADDMAVAKLGIAFWHKQSRNYYLLSDSAGPLGPVEFPIHFDFIIKEYDDPDKQKNLSDNVLLADKPEGRPVNTIQLVDELKQCSEKEKINLDTAVGLTCGESKIQIKRGNKKRYGIVAAHEIGHTIGLTHGKEKGLMDEYNQGSNLLYESDILSILNHSYRNQGGRYRSHFDRRITSGRIRHYSRLKPLVPDWNTKFTILQEEAPKSND